MEIILLQPTGAMLVPKVPTVLTPSFLPPGKQMHEGWTWHPGKGAAPLGLRSSPGWA